MGYGEPMNRRLALSVLLSMGLMACSASCGGASAGSGAQHKLLPVGSDVPALMRVDHRGKVVALRSSEPTLIYFYPKDGTPGCTKEACAFRDAWQRYSTSGLRVIGVSIDSEEAHRKFAEENSLPFSLISDPSHAWSDAFGVEQRQLMGGVDERVSFLVSKEGKVAKVYDNVDPGVHAQEVVDDARTLKLID